MFGLLAKSESPQPGSLLPGCQQYFQLNEDSCFLVRLLGLLFAADLERSPGQHLDSVLVALALQGLPDAPPQVDQDFDHGPLKVQT